MVLILILGDFCFLGMCIFFERYFRDDDGDECLLWNYVYLVVFVCLRIVFILIKLSFFFNYKLIFFWLFFYDGFKSLLLLFKVVIKVSDKKRGWLVFYFYSDVN